jgi:hypothetical protein
MDGTHTFRVEGTKMTSRAAPVQENQKFVERITTYFGIKVEVLVQMEQYSLILYQNRKSIVCTADLHSVSAVKRAA